MKLKRREILRLHNGIAMMEGRPFSVKFSYFMAKNKVAIRDEIAAIDAARQVTDGFKEYDNERAQLAQQYADKGADGSAKIHENSYVITVRKEEFDEALKELRYKYAEPLKEQEAKMEELKELLEEEVEFEGSKIDLKDIPESIESSVLEIFILADLIIEAE